MSDSVLFTATPTPPAPAAHPSTLQPPLTPALPGLSRRDWLFAFAMALLAAAVRVALADRRGLWLDEYYTLHAAQLPLRELILDRLQNGHSPLYFLYARLGFLIGHEEWMLRLTSAAATSAAVLFTTGLIGAMGLRGFLPAFWLLAVIHPYWIVTGTEYRYMMPTIALTAASGWAALRYSQGWRAGREALLALCLGLLLWIHGSAQFLALGVLIFLLREARAQAGGPWRRALALKGWPVLAGLLSSLPLLWLLKHFNQQPAKARPPKLGALLRNMNEILFDREELWTRFLDIPNWLLLWPQMAALILAVWLARRELLACGRQAAWRFIAALLVGIPAMQLLTTWLLRNTQGPARYLACLSVPLTLCLVVAWHATTIPPARRRLFRIVLGALLIVQAAAVALDRGELHREAIEWLSAQHTGQEKVLVSSSAINTFAFSYLGFPHPECLVSVGDGARKKKKDRALINEAIKRLFAQEKRGFLFLYHDRLDLDDRLKELNQTGFIKARRRLGVNRSVTVIAFIRDDSERAWLAALPEIPHPWGPSRADEPKGRDQGDSE